ncbi:MAG: EamA family transporter RarD, partial [Myxococcota bacterium]
DGRRRDQLGQRSPSFTAAERSLTIPAMSSSATPPSMLSASGIGFAVGAYFWWGLVPLYWKGILDVPATEALIPRILWTLIILWIATAAAGRRNETWTKNPREWGWAALSALLLAGNWCLFVYAIQSDQIVSASLGYYINPLVSVLLGLLVLGERLHRRQAVAIAIATCGVATIALGFGALPGISLGLAISFALYGLIHKLHPQPPLAGLTREMLILAPLCVVALLWLLRQPDSAFGQASLGEHAYLALSGIVTAVPLLLFHAATRRLPLVAVGMFQYIAPTLTLLLAILFFHESFSKIHATGFGLVWLGLGLFMFDAIRRARTITAPPPIHPSESGSR